MLKKIIREGEKKGRRRPGFSVHQHQQSLWWNAGIIQLYSGFGKDLKRPRDLKTFHISGCPNPPLSTYHLLCLFTTNSHSDSKNSTHPPLTCFIVKKGSWKGGQGADSLPSSVGEFLSASSPRPLLRRLQMNLQWQAYTNHPSCSRDPHGLPGAQSEGFKDRERLIPRPVWRSLQRLVQPSPCHRTS